MVYNVIFKEYKNGSSQIKKFSKAFDNADSNFNNGYNVAKRKHGIMSKYMYVPAEVRKQFGITRENVRILEDFKDNKELAERSLRSSFNRTISNISDLVRNNVWEYFFTFTIDSEKVDRYDFVACSKVVRVFLNNFKKRYCPDLEYILVPEMHKDGAWHFHGLFANLDSKYLTVAIHNQKKLKNGMDNKYYGQPICQNGKIVYNLNYYHFGFTTLTEIKDLKKTCSYLLKYITKELCSVTKNKRRYYYSQGLEKPIKYEMFFTNEEFTMMLRYLKNICDKKISYSKVIDISVGGYENSVFLLEFDDNKMLAYILNYYYKDYNNFEFAKNEKLLLQGQYNFVLKKLSEVCC